MILNPPQHLETIYFHNELSGHKIRVQHTDLSQNRPVILILPGLSEFCEKYYETMHDLEAAGFASVCLDWAFQGLSTRLTQNPQKRHSDGFDPDLSDLKHLVDLIRTKTNAPFFILGHSMGGHLGLRFLQDYPDLIKAAAFSAPMIGIADLKAIWRALILCDFLFKPFALNYIPGGGDWQASARPSDGSGIFSHDPLRDQIHNHWSLKNPALQVGNATIGWVLSALRSMKKLRAKENIQRIDCPVLLASAEDEKLVDNDAIIWFARQHPKIRHLHLKQTRHEILMERDEVRTQFLTQAMALFKNHLNDQ